MLLLALCLDKVCGVKKPKERLYVPVKPTRSTAVFILAVDLVFAMYLITLISQ